MAPDPNFLIENAIRTHLTVMWAGYDLAPPLVPLKFRPKTRRTCYKIDTRTGQDQLVFGLPLVWHIAEFGLHEYAKIIGVSRYQVRDWSKIQPGIYAVHHLVCHEFAHLVIRRREFNRKQKYSKPHGPVFRVELCSILRAYDPHLNDDQLYKTYQWAFDAKGLPHVGPE